MEKPRKVSELTDRELLERSVLYARQTSENTGFIKNYLIAMLIISVVAAIIVMSEL